MKTKTILVLSGRSNVGKSHALWMLIDYLCRHKQPTTVKDTRTTCRYKEHDIVVTTWGDNANEMTKNVDYMKSHSWDIAVTAARTRGATCKIIKNYANEISADIKWVGKTIDYSNPDKANREDAEKLLKIIDEIITQ